MQELMNNNTSFESLGLQMVEDSTEGSGKLAPSKLEADGITLRAYINLVMIVFNTEVGPKRSFRDKT